MSGFEERVEAVRRELAALQSASGAAPRLQAQLYSQARFRAEFVRLCRDLEANQAPFELSPEAATVVLVMASEDLL